VVDPQEAVLAVRAALQGVDGEVGDVVVVVPEVPVGGDRLSPPADDVELEALGQDQLVGVRRLYGLEESPKDPAESPVYGVEAAPKNPSCAPAGPAVAPALPAARAADPAPRYVRKLRRVIPGETSARRSRFSFLTC